jgi:predicted transcriptional regulator YdeE
MSTVTEIETAIEKLPPQKVEELAAWLDEYRQTTHASDATFSLYDEEENRPN